MAQDCHTSEPESTMRRGEITMINSHPLQQTCFLMQEGNELEAQEILQHIQYATIFHSLKYNVKVQLALLGKWGHYQRGMKR